MGSLGFSFSLLFTSYYISHNHKPQETTAPIPKTHLSNSKSTFPSRALIESSSSTFLHQVQQNQGPPPFFPSVISSVFFFLIWLFLVIQDCWKRWRFLCTICHRNTTWSGFQMNGVRTTCLLRRWPFIELFWTAITGHLIHLKLIFSSSLFMFLATSAPLMASPPLAMPVPLLPPP